MLVKTTVTVLSVLRCCCGDKEALTNICFVTSCWRCSSNLLTNKKTQRRNIRLTAGALGPGSPPWSTSGCWELETLTDSLSQLLYCWDSHLAVICFHFQGTWFLSSVELILWDCLGCFQILKKELKEPVLQLSVWCCCFFYLLFLNNEVYMHCWAAGVREKVKVSLEQSQQHNHRLRSDRSQEQRC